MRANLPYLFLLSCVVFGCADYGTQPPQITRRVFEAASNPGDTGLGDASLEDDEDGGACEPQCGDRVCGDDGCGGSCGDCENGMECSELLGECFPATCTPQCDGRVCGTDHCGGVCGDCAEGTFCDPLRGQCDCTPSCVGRACGDDGCGGSCGTCAPGYTCDYENSCQPPEVPVDDTCPQEDAGCFDIYEEQ
jgi:hypothetical protein